MCGTELLVPAYTSFELNFTIMKMNVNHGNELIYDRSSIKLSLEISENLCFLYFSMVCSSLVVRFNKDGAICLSRIASKHFLS